MTKIFQIEFKLHVKVVYTSGTPHNTLLSKYIHFYAFMQSNELDQHSARSNLSDEKSTRSLRFLVPQKNPFLACGVMFARTASSTSVAVTLSKCECEARVRYRVAWSILLCTPLMDEHQSQMNFQRDQRLAKLLERKQ